MSARLRPGVADERKERLTLRLVAVPFFIVAAYVSFEGVRSLIGSEEPQRSPVAIVLLVLSLIAMPVLAAAKTRVGKALKTI